MYDEWLSDCPRLMYDGWMDDLPTTHVSGGFQFDVNLGLRVSEHEGVLRVGVVAWPPHAPSGAVGIPRSLGGRQRARYGSE